MSKRSAIAIYSGLVVLTLIELGIVMSGLPKMAAAILMTGTTATKVLLIGLYFMHIKNDRPVAWLLPVIPIILATLFVLALFPDLVYHLPLHFQ